jgi:lysine biosynthesis protein LysW
VAWQSIAFSIEADKDSADRRLAQRKPAGEEWKVKMTVKDTTRKAVTACPECGQRIALTGRPELGRRLVCTHCGAELKVVEREPLRLGKAYTE